MADFTIQNVSVRDVVGINGALQPTVSKQVTYYIGKNGPFILTYPIGAYSADAVNADMQKEVDTLKGISGNS